jgi:multicomponent Na+:H+ antiporter subunit B
VVRPDSARDHGDVLVRVVARLLPAPSLVVAAALIAKGYAEVGDGFGAGVLVALAIALNYIALGAPAAEDAMPALRRVPALALGGLAVALVAGFFPLVLGQPRFSHRPAPGEPVTTIGAVELFTPLVFDVGIFMLVVGLMVILLHQLADPDTSRRTSPTEQDRGERRP